MFEECNQYVQLFGELKRYFADINNVEKFIRNPFTVKIESMNFSLNIKQQSQSLLDES